VHCCSAYRERRLFSIALSVCVLNPAEAGLLEPGEMVVHYEGCVCDPLGVAFQRAVRMAQNMHV